MEDSWDLVGPCGSFGARFIPALGWLLIGDLWIKNMGPVVIWAEAEPTCMNFTSGLRDTGWELLQKGYMGQASAPPYILGSL